MKKFYMLMVALLCGAAAMAQGYENEIYVPDVEVKAGSEATAQICLRNAEPLVLAITWKVQNPSGVNIKMPTSAAKYTLVPDRLDVETAKIVEKFWKKQEYDDGDIDEDEYIEACEAIDAKDDEKMFAKKDELEKVYQPIITRIYKESMPKDENGNPKVDPNMFGNMFGSGNFAQGANFDPSQFTQAKPNN